ncbi:MAG: acetyl-CoA carboxylase carboxyltransferase subunit alpha [Candidatus Omnitrophica bacterium]|nr:acetyl-CoA carboxylase carboxyltransferase subunit alpha [Candidatus Omnitrophota bacterium]MCM8808782.1 acetyl-CoA carboxylase carboxyltransferase subunit alpha [Candidatus Omnitrophota bacterium]MCM8811133.1 acetyl-CoA carboxylase carboxyltransferase subunit alpha [Candidatus Omnitrophota bacterium]MCM8833056.1 acetyl-CoA carboxylase carboxyltransferase subunit alpha [Candidatus Omnitrophota bacterium]
MERKYLPFEKPIEEIEKKIEEIEKDKIKNLVEKNTEILKLRQLLKDRKKEIYSNLTSYQIVQVARHPNRPHTLDYLNNIFDEYIELHGDRVFKDDPSIVGGFGKFCGITVAFVGHQKGRDTKENIERKFGMAHPEGYRKALRIMKLAEKFTIPVIIFIDTPGANPDIGAEERGQALSIASNIYEMSLLKIPILCIIIGEGGSGGALGIGVGDRILMQEFSIYSVISPEGCASILWKSQDNVEEAAESLKLTAKDLFKLGIIDEIIPEPPGGAHSDWETTFKITKEIIEKNLKEIKTINVEELVEMRYKKYRKIGVFLEGEESE